MKKFLFLSFWIFFAVSCKPEDPPLGYGTISGFTFIMSTNEPLPGLEVMLFDNPIRIDTTDIDGLFEFKDVLEGEHNLSFFKNSQLILSKTTNVVEGNNTLVQMGFEYSMLPKEELPDFSVIDISDEDIVDSRFNLDWEYEVAGKQEYFYIDVDVETQLPRFVEYHFSKTEKCYGIAFDEKGLPRKVFADGYIFLFDNFNENKVDLGILSPEGEIQIIREIQTDFVWPTPPKGAQSRADVIRWTGRILGAIPCVASGAAAFVTGGAAIPLALWTCGNYLLSMTNNFFDDANVENGFTRFVDKYHLAGTIYTCTDPNISSCLVIFAQAGLDRYADYVEEMDEREELIRIVEASLYAGYGDVQITLTWNNESDLDLHVIDPFGEEIFWDSPSSTSGGILDYDDTNGYGPENVYWPISWAPPGTYQIFVHDYVWEGKPQSANYIVLITAFGNTKKFTGTVTLDKTVHIVDFNEKGIKSAKSADETQRIDTESKKVK